MEKTFVIKKLEGISDIYFPSNYPATGFFMVSDSVLFVNKRTQLVTFLCNSDDLPESSNEPLTLSVENKTQDNMVSENFCLKLFALSNKEKYSDLK